MTEDETASIGGPLDWLAAAEARVLDTNEVRSVVVRPPIMYKDAQGPVQRMVERAQQDQVARYIDEGSNAWSTVHVRDLARAYAQLLESSESGVFHVAEGIGGTCAAWT